MPSNDDIALAIAVDLMVEFEGFSKTAYPDPIYGWDVPTIGYGTTRYPDGSRVKKGDTITPEHAKLCKLHSLTKCLTDLRKMPTWKQMNVNQRAALLSFGYNLGTPFYKQKNRQSITQLCDTAVLWDDREYVFAQFVKYRNPGSRAESGLHKRRKLEAALFLKEVPCN